MKKLKTYIFGGEKIGKSELLKQLLSPEYISTIERLYEPTKGARYSQITIANQSDENGILIELWEIGGQARFKSMVHVIGSHSDLGLYCIDLSQMIDEIKLQEIITDINKFKDVNPDARLIIVGTKNDIALPNALSTICNQLKDLNYTAAVATSAQTADGSKDFYTTFCSEANKKLLWNEQDNEEFDRFYEPVNQILKARNRCAEDSDLFHALNTLNDETIDLPHQIINGLGIEVNKLLNNIQDPSTPDKAKSIDSFHQSCNDLLQENYHEIKRFILSVIIAAVITIIAGMIGFGIGFALGAWSGPGAFFTGLTTGYASALLVTGSTSLAGLGTLVYSAHQFFKTSSVQDSISEIGKKAAATEATALLI